MFFSENNGSLTPTIYTPAHLQKWSVHFSLFLVVRNFTKFMVRCDTKIFATIWAT